jgi:hypothetical protein
MLRIIRLRLLNLSTYQLNLSKHIPFLDYTFRDRLWITKRFAKSA